MNAALGGLAIAGSPSEDFLPESGGSLAELFSSRLYYTLKCPGHVDVLFAHHEKSKRGIGLPKHEEDLIVRRFRARVADCDDEREETG